MIDPRLLAAEAILAGRRIEFEVRASKRAARLEKLAMERLAKRMKARRLMPPSKFPMR